MNHPIALELMWEKVAEAAFLMASVKSL